MKTFICIAVLMACALAAPAPEDGKRDKRSYWHGGLGGLGAYSTYSLDAPLLSHAPLVYSAPAAIIHEPAIVSVKKIVSVPEVVSVKKIVSYPHVTRVAHYVAAPHVTRVAHYSAPRVSYSYAPSYSAGWW